MQIEQIFEGLITKPTGAFTYDYDIDAKDYDGEDPVLAKLLTNIETTGLRLVKGLRLNITQNITSNIIYYKDAFKIPNPALRVPYILYGKNETKEYAIVLVPKMDGGYIIAKGLYYCLTEKEGVFDNAMNSIIALYLDPDTYPDLETNVKDFIGGTKSAGAIQRHFDYIYNVTPELFKQEAITVSNELFDRAKALIEETPEKKEAIITNVIGACYVIKKCIYVSFMKNKNILNTQFAGDIKKQRHQAKLHSNEIPFVSYADLWRYGKPSKDIENKPEKTEEQDYQPIDYASLKTMERAETPEEVARRIFGDIFDNDKTEDEK